MKINDDIKTEKHYAYMLRCADNTIYSGYTNNLEKRLISHNKGIASKYTRVRLPVTLVYYEEFETKSEALKREASFKKLNRNQKEELIAAFKTI